MTRTPIAVALLLFGAHALAAPPGIRVDPAGLPTPATGLSTEKIANTTEVPDDYGCAGQDVNDCGQFRISCARSHMGYDDPLIYGIGEVNKSHLHLFVANTNTDENTDQDVDPRDDVPMGNSTCVGGTVNTSRYWVPPLIDTRTGRPIAGNGNESFLVYYKAEWVNIIPPDFRMIAGNSASTSAQSTGIVTFGCNGVGCPSGVWTDLQAQPVTTGMRLWTMLDFPQCVAMDGLAPYGTMSGTLTGWRWLLIGHGDDTNELMYRSETPDTDVTDIVVSGGGGAAAPVVTTIPGTATTTERAFIRFADLTAGQSVTVAGHTYTSTGATTAAEVAKAFSGGTPVATSPDHKAHVAYATGTPFKSCPTAFPYRIPSIRFTVSHAISDDETYKHVRLSSDAYSGPGGYSFHGDFRNGWNPEVMGAWINSCNRLGLDCNSRLLGNRDHNNDVLPSYRRLNF